MSLGSGGKRTVGLIVRRCVPGPVENPLGPWRPSFVSSIVPPACRSEIGRCIQGGGSGRWKPTTLIGGPPGPVSEKTSSVFSVLRRNRSIVTLHSPRSALTGVGNVALDDGRNPMPGTKMSSLAAVTAMRLLANVQASGGHLTSTTTRPSLPLSLRVNSQQPASGNEKLDPHSVPYADSWCCAANVRRVPVTRFAP